MPQCVAAAANCRGHTMLGSAAAVDLSDAPLPSPAPMDSDVEVKIPSFYIGLSNGIMLRTNFLYGTG